MLRPYKETPQDMIVLIDVNNLYTDKNASTLDKY